MSCTGMYVKLMIVKWGDANVEDTSTICPLNLPFSTEKIICTGTYLVHMYMCTSVLKLHCCTRTPTYIFLTIIDFFVSFSQ